MIALGRACPFVVMSRVATPKVEAKQSIARSMRRPPKSAEIGVLRPGRSHIQAVFAPMAEEEGDIGLLSVVVWAFLAQCDHFLKKIEFVKDLSLRTKTCDVFRNCPLK